MKRILTGLVLIAAGILAGAALGLLYVKLFVPKTGMGFDGLADALGGMMLGALIGMIAGGLMAFRLPIRKQWMGVGVALALAVVTFGGLVLTAPKREPAPPPVVKKAFRPTFRVKLRVSHTREILEAVAPDDRPLPFTEAEISTGKSGLVLVGWGPDFDRCTAIPIESDLESLVPLIRDANGVAGPFCRTPDDDLTLAANWSLAGKMGGQGLDAGCLDQDHEAIRTLAAAINEIGSRLCR